MGASHSPSSDRPPQLPFPELFEFLRAIDYRWEPQTPERLLQLRKTAESYDPVTQALGLGVFPPAESLESSGMPAALVRGVLGHRWAVSRAGDTFIVHSHWPADPERAADYVYYGRESQLLAAQLERHAESIAGKRILDLGSGSGGLSFLLAPRAREVRGLEPSAQAVRWSNAAAQAQGFTHLEFRQAAIGQPSADAAVSSGGPWEVAIFNPPMTIPRPQQSLPHRDGGRLGIELPLKFIDFSLRHLQSRGEILALVTNPWVKGHAAFFEELKTRPWEILERTILDEHFNQSLARKENYEALGIQRIELCFLRLRKRN